MEIDYRQLVRDTLIDTYVQHRGESPEGGFTPDDNVLAILRQAYKDPESMVRFLRDSMYAHMSRTELTRTPFFVNTHLLADSSIEYLEKHRAYLRSFYGAAVAAKAFESGVYASVLGSETDFFDLFGTFYLRSGQYKVRLDLMAPSVWWVIWSIEFGRVTIEQIPPGWFEQTTKVNGIRRKYEGLFHEERAKLSKDSARRKVAEKAALAAMHQAALSWCVRQHVVRMIYGDDGATPATDSKIDLDLLKVLNPLTDRDQKLFAAVREFRPMAPVVPRPASTKYSDPIQTARTAMEVHATLDA